MSRKKRGCEEAHFVYRVMTFEPHDTERATSMSRVMAFSQNSLILERFWCEVRISFGVPQTTQKNQKT